MSLKQHAIIFEAGSPLLGPDENHAMARERLSKADETVRFLLY